MAIDEPHQLLFVACTDGAETLDVAHDGKPVGRIKTGNGVDNIEYDSPRRRLLVAAAKDGTLTIAQVTAGGALTVEATVPTSKGARNPVTDARGLAYLADSEAGRILVIDPSVAVGGGISVQEQQAGLLDQAKVRPEAAIATARARLPKAQLVAAEIEREHGKVIYSFDFKTDGQTGSDEVSVDALTGKVLSVNHETPKDEAREKAADARAARKKAASQEGR